MFYSFGVLCIIISGYIILSTDFILSPTYTLVVKMEHWLPNSCLFLQFHMRCKSFSDFSISIGFHLICLSVDGGIFLNFFFVHLLFWFRFRCLMFVVRAVCPHRCSSFASFAEWQLTCLQCFCVTRDSIVFHFTLALSRSLALCFFFLLYPIHFHLAMTILSRHYTLLLFHLDKSELSHLRDIDAEEWDRDRRFSVSVMLKIRVHCSHKT